MLAPDIPRPDFESHNRVLFVLAAIASLGSLGCVPHNRGVELNAARSMTTSLDDQALFRAVVETIEARGWTVQSTNASRGWLVAHEPDIADADMVTRQRWLVHVDAGTVSAQMYLDFYEQRRWQSYPVVCDGYDYSQEFALLETIEQTAFTATSVSSNTDTNTKSNRR